MMDSSRSNWQTPASIAVLWLAFPFLPWWGTALVAGLAGVLLRRDRLALAALAIPAVVVAAGELELLRVLWPLGLYIALAVAALIAPKPLSWTARGALGRREVLPILALALGVAVVLPLWAHFAQPDLSDVVERLPDWPLPLLVALGLCFSVLNAVAEEAAWRGLLWSSLERLPIPLLVGIQALAFGLAHIEGVPRGWPGVALATGYGLLLGGLRMRSGGLLAPIAAHIVADIVIYVMIGRIALG